MQKASPEYTLLVLSIASPLLLGVYRNGELLEKIESEKKTSEVLLAIVSELLGRYALSGIIYTRGPGSYMSIKLSYIILKTIEIVKGIPLAGCSAFSCNGGAPIRAIGNLYFVKEGESIVTKRFNEPLPQLFSLPASLQGLSIDPLSIPDYTLPAVQPAG